MNDAPAPDTAAPDADYNLYDIEFHVNDTQGLPTQSKGRYAGKTPEAAVARLLAEWEQSEPRRDPAVISVTLVTNG